MAIVHNPMLLTNVHEYPRPETIKETHGCKLLNKKREDILIEV